MKFGSREIVDVVFKAAANNQKVGNKLFKQYQPVFIIDTARTSSMEQATTTVYAQGKYSAPFIGNNNSKSH